VAVGIDGANVLTVEVTSPEGDRAVVVARRVPRLWPWRRRAVRQRHARTDEHDDPSGVADEKSRQNEVVERTDGHRRIWADGLSDLVDPLVDAGREARRRPFHERQQSVADGVG